MHQITSAESACIDAARATFEKLGPSQPHPARDCDRSVIRGLAAKDFHIFEDGVEQKVQGVRLEPLQVVAVRDSRGQHGEFSYTPRGIWSSIDIVPPTPPPTEVSFYHGGYVPVVMTNIYRVAYVPPKSMEGSCHKISVQVDRRNALVYALADYCNTQSPSDILNGDPFGKRMELDLASKDNGGITLGLQAGWFFTVTDKARVDFALEIPWGSLTYEYADFVTNATIGLLAVMAQKDGSLTMRLSDFACCGPGTGKFVRTDARARGNLEPDLRSLTAEGMPTRYEAQVNVPPGEYELQVVLSDGTKFGRAQAPLMVENYDKQNLALSSVMLCKRYRDAHVAAVERAAVNFAPRHVPLVSKGIEFTPTGDTRFKKGEPLIPYFEVYEPLLATQPTTGGQPTPSGGPAIPAQARTQGGQSSEEPSATLTVAAHIRIVEATTGQLIKDFPPVDAAPYVEPGSSTIPIARQIPFDELAKGTYCLEVQATDSAGGSTPWRTAEFTAE
jgi:hypothetical protein